MGPPPVKQSAPTPIFAKQSPCKRRLISGGDWDRRRGCRAVESPASCPNYPAAAPAFRDRRPTAGTRRHWTLQACRRETRSIAPRSRPSRLESLGNNRPCSVTEAARSLAAGSPVLAEPAHSPQGRPHTTRSKGTMKISSTCSENELRAYPFPAKRWPGLTICGSGSAKNAPSAASAGARRD
jgi:hypothetical protein